MTDEPIDWSKFTTCAGRGKLRWKDEGDVTVVTGYWMIHVPTALAYATDRRVYVDVTMDSTSETSLRVSDAAVARSTEVRDTFKAVNVMLMDTVYKRYEANLRPFKDTLEAAMTLLTRLKIEDVTADKRGCVRLFASDWDSHTHAIGADVLQALCALPGMHTIRVHTVERAASHVKCIEVS
jgi:hypothetical protein